MQASRPSWQGEIRLVGFPVKVAAWNMVKRNELGFKQLDPVHLKPVQQMLVNIAGEEVNRDELRRGYQDGSSSIYPLPEDVLEQIQAQERTRSLDPAFPPRANVEPWLKLATSHYELTPPEKDVLADPDNAGESLNVLWNGLKATKRVLVTEWVKRAGGRPAIVVIEAADDRLVAHEIPYTTELQEAPVAWQPTTDRAQAGLFKKFMEVVGTDAVQIEDIKDTYSERRDAVVKAALAGEKIALSDEKPPAPTAVGDLMTALKQSVDEKSKSPRPKTAKKKVTA